VIKHKKLTIVLRGYQGDDRGHGAVFGIKTGSGKKALFDKETLKLLIKYQGKKLGYDG